MRTLLLAVLFVTAVMVTPVQAWWTQAEYTSLAALHSANGNAGSTALRLSEMIHNGINETMRAKTKEAWEALEGFSISQAKAQSYMLNVDPDTDDYCQFRDVCVAAGLNYISAGIGVTSMREYMVTARAALQSCGQNVAGQCGFNQTATFRLEANQAASFALQAINAIDTINTGLSYTTWNFHPFCPSQADCRVVSDRHGNYLQFVNNLRKSLIAAGTGGIAFAGVFDWTTDGSSTPWPCCSEVSSATGAGYGFERLLFRLTGSNTRKLASQMLRLVGIINVDDATSFEDCIPSGADPHSRCTPVMTPGLFVEQLVSSSSASQDRKHDTEGLAYHMRQIDGDSFQPIMNNTRSRCVGSTCTKLNEFIAAWQIGLNEMWYRSDISVWDAFKIDQTEEELQTKRARKTQANDPHGPPISCYWAGNTCGL